MEPVTSRILGGTPLVSTKRISKRNSLAYSVTSAFCPDQIAAVGAVTEHHGRIEVYPAEQEEP